MPVSLSALKAFESAARQGSFKKAAQELAISPAAVSHHIQNLESRLKVPLFIRRTRKIELTELGKRLALATTEGFYKIDTAVNDIINAGQKVTVNTTSSFAALVLLPSLNHFYRQHPEIEVEVSTSESIENHAYAISIRMGEQANIAASEQLKTEHFNLYSTTKKTTNAALAKQIIYSTRWKNAQLPQVSVAKWFSFHQLDIKFKQQQFDLELFAIQQALNEQALVFCSTTLADDFVQRQQLFPVRPQALGSTLCYYIANKERLEGRAVRLFIRWLEARLAE